jgi:hypothetical protein
LFVGCPPDQVGIPEDVFALRDEVIAVRGRGPAGRLQRNQEIPLDRLRKLTGDFEEVILLEYAPGVAGIKKVPHQWKGKNIAADLVGGQTYLIYAKPRARLLDNYYVLCKFDRYRYFLDDVQLDFADRICPLILCTPDLLPAVKLFEKFPQLEPIRNELDFGDRKIGGWELGGTGGVCGRCTSLRKTGLVFPIKECWPPPPIRAKVKVVNMIPRSQSAETNQDSEPFLAVDTNPQRMAGTAFTPNPFGTSSGLAPIYVSEDGGDTWRLNMIVPSAGALTGTGDITVATTEVARRLYGGILRVPGNFLLNTLRTNDFTASTPMTVLSSRTLVDQPFVQATTASEPVGCDCDRVYVGNNDLALHTFYGGNGRTATVDVSLDGGSTWNSIRIETRGTLGQDGPSVRPTVARDGTVYAAYFGWRSKSGSIRTSDVVVVRDDNGATGPNPFQILTDPADGIAGRLVVQNVSIPWNTGSALGQERIGSTLSIAVDPNNSSTVYIAFFNDTATTEIYTIHVRRSTTGGVTWSGDLRTITNATCVAVAVADNGTVGLLYQKLTGTGASSRWVTHLEQTRNAFSTFKDTILATVPNNTPARVFGPYIGDYNFLLAVGDEFQGVFSANNTPDLANFPQGVKYQRRANFTTKTLLDLPGNPVGISIDPYYFSVEVMR